MINLFPDHMHEGEVTTPWSLTEQIPLLNGPFTEYPLKNGQPFGPDIVA